MATNHPNKIQATIHESDLILKEFIARGGSGDVYRAIWKSDKLGEIEVAAKKIHIPKGTTVDDLLGNEVFYLQKLDHPNIIKYYGLVITEYEVVIVTEYASKGSLYDYLKRLQKDKKSLPRGRKSKWAIQAARSIKYLQENKILHRDIKSPNFLITADDNLKVCDFGIAKDLTSTKTTSSEKGTPRWLAPEVFIDQQLSPKADIFSFGIVLWEMESFEIPYKDTWDLRIQWIVGNGERPKIPTTCPKPLEALMQRCWDKDRDKRPDVNEIIRQLESEKQTPLRPKGIISDENHLPSTSQQTGVTSSRRQQAYQSRRAVSFEEEPPCSLNESLIIMVAKGIQTQWRELARSLGFSDEDCNEFDERQSITPLWLSYLPALRMLRLFERKTSGAEGCNGRTILADAVRPLDVKLYRNIVKWDKLKGRSRTQSMSSPSAVVTE